MSGIIRMVFVMGFLSAFYEKVLSNPVAEAEDIESLIPELEEYTEGGGWELDPLSPYMYKRGGFWSPHPSDYNPMRRPSGSVGQIPRGSSAKKSDSEYPYHPVPRAVNQHQKNTARISNSGPTEDLETLLEGLRDKRQSPGSFLLMKLGTLKNKSGGQDVNRRLGRRRA